MSDLCQRQTVNPHHVKVSLLGPQRKKNPTNSAMQKRRTYCQHPVPWGLASSSRCQECWRRPRPHPHSQRPGHLVHWPLWTGSWCNAEHTVNSSDTRSHPEQNDSLLHITPKKGQNISDPTLNHILTLYTLDLTQNINPVYIIYSTELYIWYRTEY